MAHFVKCIYCQQQFNRDKEDCVQVSSRRYAHSRCFKEHENQKSQEEKDKQALDDYIINLFHLDYVQPRIRKQINNYMEQYNYTYSGILRTLIYCYEIKKNDVSKANGGIGIVPYLYQEAYEYYYKIWLTKEKNKDSNNQKILGTIRRVHIKPPQRKKRKKTQFNFLNDEEGDNNIGK